MTKTNLKINGLMCGHCEAHVNEAIKKAFKVKSVTSSHESGTAEIISAAPLDEAELKSVVKDAGYTLTEISTEPYSGGLLSFFKKH